MPDTVPNQDFSSRNQILEDAWFRFAKYDKNASIAQKRFIRQRRWILILGVTATLFGVSYSVIEPLIKDKKLVPPFGATVEEWLNVLHFPVLIVPILLGVLVAISVKFNMGISWVMLRSSAEAIKKEIYRYRMQVGEYNPEKLTPAESRDVRLARSLKLVSKRLMQTPVNQTDLLAYEGSLPPKYGTAEGDDGFSDLNSEQYLAWRVEDQFSYYQKKAARLGKSLRRFQLLVFLLSAVGTLLAGLKFDVWIAVSSAVAAAVAAYLEFLRVEPTVVAFNISAADLYDIRVWWHSLAPEARTQRVNIETLVASAEAVLQTENVGWLQEMREALAEIYGEKKDKDAHDGSKLLDEVNPALQPSPIAGLPSQDTVDRLQPAAEPKPEPAPVVATTPLNSVQPQSEVTGTLPISTPSSTPDAKPADSSQPEIAVDVSDSTAAEAVR